jgi:hypothetical protein
MTAMTAIRTLVFATALIGLASPALAGDGYSFWWRYSYADAPANWVCGAFEARHKCNAEFTLRHDRCGCIVR